MKMKRKLQFIIGGAAASFLVITAMAQEKGAPRYSDSDMTNTQGIGRQNDATRASGSAATNAASSSYNSALNARDRGDATNSQNMGWQNDATRASSSAGTNADAAADNTARNVRDRNSASVTPLDQGNNRADLDTTARIRKEVIAQENMSVNARNVKIITRDGRVTLRGPVASDDEKRLIGEIADRIARSGNVDNQLEVNLKTTRND